MTRTAEIAAAYAAGERVADIAARFGVAERWVRKSASKEGVTRGPAVKVTDEQIAAAMETHGTRYAAAKALGVNVNTLRKRGY